MCKLQLSCTMFSFTRSAALLLRPGKNNLRRRVKIKGSSDKGVSGLLDWKINLKFLLSVLSDRFLALSFELLSKGVGDRVEAIICFL